jgi:hypothetical protein
MDIQYKVVDFDQAHGALTVEFDHVGQVRIDLPVGADGKFPTGDALHSLIIAKFPAHALDRVSALQTQTNASEIAAMVGSSASFSSTQIAQPAQIVTTVAKDEPLPVEKL